VQFVNLWELWSDPYFLTPSQRTWLDGVEPFDEWEEFALFAAHYFLLTARTKPGPREGPAPSEEDARSKTSTKTACDLAPARKSCGLEFVGNPKSQGLRRHGALLRLQDELGYKQTAIAHHGGMTYEGRTSTWDVYSPSSEHGDGAPRVPPVRITARQCHTITRLENGRSILIGGRTSPAVGMQDCYIQTESGWLPIQDLPVPRYRHSAAAVLLPNLVPGLLIVGGKCAADRVEDEIILWDRAVGWRSLHVFRGSPQPRFGATLVALGDDFGLLSGGMQVDGVVLQDLWRWKIIYRDERAVGIHFTACALKIDTGAGLYLGRFGASHCLRKDQLLLIGGIALSGCVESFFEVLSLDLSSLSHTDEKNEGSLQLLGIDLRRDSSVPRPMLVGHATLDSADDETLIVGGGAVCFSFGTYWNTGIYILHGSNAAACPSWALVDSSTEAAPAKKVSLGVNGLQAARLDQPGSVERVTLGGTAEFPDLVRQSKPMILERLYFGQCRSLWSKDYLRSKIGAERPVVVHEAQGRTMNFQQKDFAYMKKPFGIFLDEIHNGGHQYLRSILLSDPSKRAADLDLDFPEIAQDFSIPLELRFVAERHHSSPLRISGDVAMWLHVDTMANVLFQIEGSKRLVLFPPADMVNLDFAPGSTTSSVEIFRDGDPREIRSVPKTHPVEVTLRPGEVIFIPPLWAHTAAPLQKVSAAVNVFFRNLSNGYAAGRDVYGNRDLEAYEHGRRDIAKIARAFDGIPPDLAHAYLLRLAGELRSKAERYAPVSD
jgi:tRNA wybutosine-synthesizing protein 4